MKIDLQKLINGTVREIPFAGTVDMRGEAFFGEHPFQHPVTYQGAVKSHLDVLRLNGEVETTYVTACARCAKPLEVPIHVPVDMLLMRDGDDQEESEDVFLIAGDQVDPEEVLVPALLLEIDMAYLCKPDCNGLCPHCGADRNLTQCECGEKQIDDRFAVLQKLLDRKQNED